jgi:hypothetical protein
MGGCIRVYDPAGEWSNWKGFKPAMRGLVSYSPSSIVFVTLVLQLMEFDILILTRERHVA